MKKNFVGNVKPHVELDKMALKVNFGEAFALEEWQTAHPQFKFALKNGWVLAADRKSLALNPAESVVRHAPFKDPKEAVKTTQKEAAKKLVANGVAPGVAHDALQQSLKLVGITTNPAPDNQLLKELLNHQRQMLDVLSQQRQEPTPEVVNLLKEIKDTLATGKGTGAYNKADANGFKVVDVEPEKYVAKVEDLNVKSGKIVTEQHSTGSVEDALAVLKKLKGK